MGTAGAAVGTVATAGAAVGTTAVGVPAAAVAGSADAAKESSSWVAGQAALTAPVGLAGRTMNVNIEQSVLAAAAGVAPGTVPQAYKFTNGNRSDTNAGFTLTYARTDETSAVMTLYGGKTVVMILTFASPRSGKLTIRHAQANGGVQMSEGVFYLN